MAAPPGVSGTVSSTGSAGIFVSQQEIFQLQQYLKEATYREQLLEQKLAALQSVLHATQEASETSWNALIDEERLLSRIEMLENQLHCFSKVKEKCLGKLNTKISPYCMKTLYFSERLRR